MADSNWWTVLPWRGVICTQASTDIFLDSRQASPLIKGFPVIRISSPHIVDKES